MTIMTSVAENVSAVLHDNWSLSDPLKTSIEWGVKRVDVITWLKTSGKTYAIACYSPGLTAEKVIASNWWRVDETVTVDLCIKVSPLNINDMLAKRTAMRNEILRIIHDKQNSITDVQFAYPVREPVQVEAENMLRLTILVNCVYFHKKT
jgi:hypothetical protein